MRRTAIVIVLAVAGCAPVVAPGSATPSRSEAPLTREAYNLFAALSETGVPDVARAPYVLVHTGHIEYDRRGQPREAMRRGFLLEEDEACFVVLHDLTAVTYRREEPPPSAAGLRAARFEVVRNPVPAWRRHAAFLVRNLGGADHVAASEIQDEWEALRPAVRAVVDDDFYWRAEFMERVRSYHSRWRRFRPNLALVLLAYHVHRQGHPTLSMHILRDADKDLARLTLDLAHAQMWAAIEASSRIPVDHRRLLRTFQQLRQRFPDSPYVDRIDEIITVLERMVEEDGRRDGRDSATDAERLIYELRNDPTIEEQLEELGFAAVPALIHAADDPRLLPALHDPELRLLYNGMYYRGPSDAPIRIRRYREVALRVLSRLARRHFETRAEAEAWWSSIGHRGEYAVLLDQIRTQSGDWTRAADRLVELDADRAIRDMVQVAETTEEIGVFGILLSVVAENTGEVQIPFLRRVARTARNADDRLEAIEGLARRNADGWLDLLPAELRRSLRGVGAAPGSLFRIVVEFGDAPGIRMLQRNWQWVSREDRETLFFAFEELPSERWASSGLLDEAIATSLEAEGASYSSSGGGTRGGEEYVCHAPEFRDSAAALLADWFDQPFDCRWSPWRKASERARLHNLWRQRRGLPDVPVPSIPEPPAPDARAVAELRRALSRAADADQRREAIDRLVPGGLVGLSTLEAALGADAHAAAREHAALTLNQLASTVREVRIRDRDHLIAQRAQWDALQGRTLQAPSVVHLLEELTSSATDAAFEFQLYRSDEGLGVDVAIRAERVPAQEGDTITYTGMHLRTGDTVLASGSFWARGFDFSSLQGQLEAILTADSGLPGEARFRWEWHEPPQQP